MKLILLFLSCFFYQSVFSYWQAHETPLVKYLKPMEILEGQSGMEMIDCIYVINLDKRLEKWHRTNVLLRQKGLFPNRFAAVDGWKIPQEIQKELAGPYPVRLAPGHLGCLLSHISVIHDAFIRGFNHIWVFEDDIEFKVEVSKVLEILNELNSLDPDWDIFYTDSDSFVISSICDFRPDQPHKKVNQYRRRRKISKNLMKSGLRYGAYSIIVSKRGIEKIHNYFTHVYLWCNLDWDIHYIPDIKEYSYRGKLVSVPYSNFSDTRDYHPL